MPAPGIGKLCVYRKIPQVENWAGPEFCPAIPFRINDDGLGHVTLDLSVHTGDPVNPVLNKYNISQDPPEGEPGDTAAGCWTWLP